MEATLDARLGAIGAIRECIETIRQHGTTVTGYVKVFDDKAVVQWLDDIDALSLACRELQEIAGLTWDDMPIFQEYIQTGVYDAVLYQYMRSEPDERARIRRYIEDGLPC